MTGCANETYWSAVADEDGVVTVTVECDAYPDPDCGFRAEADLPWGATGSTVNALNQAHSDGRPDVIPVLMLLAACDRVEGEYERRRSGR